MFQLILILTGTNNLTNLSFSGSLSKEILMTKTELIDRINKNKEMSTVTKKQIGIIVDAMFTELGTYFIKTKASPKGDPKLTYPGFGTFKKRKRNAKKGRNPQTGKEITIPTHYTVTFTPSSILKGKMNPARAKAKAKAAAKAKPKAKRTKK
jgi:nucleoid DNA-binding protein